jgi:carbonic anhydrase
MDSRVPPEIIFDQGIGNIFVLRNAGNIEDENILGSIEYAVKFAGAKLLVVMGHTKCGAVSGAIKNVDAGNLTQLLNQIKPAIPEAAYKNDLVNITAKNNVLMTIKDILKRSKIINELVNSGDISIVGAIYEVETGRVLFIE